jgi:hypothetical protein
MTMAVYENEKRKNDAQRPFPWWLLVIGFISGVIVMLILTQGGQSQPVNVNSLSAYSREELQLTATAVADDITSLGTHNLEGVEPLFATATAIILGATQQAVMTAIETNP